MNTEAKWPGGGTPQEPDIILIALDRKNYYLFKGEDHLNQLLLADGEFPRPVLCVHFKTIIEIRAVFGDGVSIAQLWGINPQIVARLRDDEHLIETEA